ncbi:MAG: AAA family ATPase [candidate division Zixibacteria bacterium]|nr:AAA family ATPase [candidate division Zixibacteria bacterium]
MIIRSLQLKNFRRFINCELEFPEGIIGFVGSNGAGKSTIVEAISWVLFGNTAARSGKDEIRYAHADSAAECQVIMDFELENNQYRIVRTLKGRTFTADASLFSGNKLIAKSAKGTTSEVVKILGMDLKNFRISFFAKQKELNALSDIIPSERERHIIQLLGISDIDEAIKLIRRDSSQRETKIESNLKFMESISTIDADIEKLEKELTTLNNRIDTGRKVTEERKSKADQARKEFAEANTNKEKYQKLHSQMEKAKDQVENYEASLKDFKSQAESLERFRKEAANLENETAKYESLKQSIEAQREMALKYNDLLAKRARFQELLNERNQLEEEVAELNKEVSIGADIENKLGKADNESKSLSSDINSKQDRLTELNSQVKSRSDKLKELQEQLDNIQNLGPDSVCDRCLRPMGDDYNSIYNHLQSEIIELEKERADTQQKLRAAKDEMKELNNRKKTLDKSIQELNNRQASIRRASKSLEAEKRRLHKTEESIAKIEKEISELEKLKYDPDMHKKIKAEFENVAALRDKYIGLSQRIESLKDVPQKITDTQDLVSKLKEHIDKLQKEIREVDYSPQEYAKAEKEKEETGKKYQKAQLTLKDLESQLKMAEKDISHARKELETKDRLTKEVQSLRKEKERLLRLEGIFKQFREDLVGRIRPALSVKSSEYLDMLTDGNYPEMEVGEGYKLLIEDNGSKYEIERFSGGEKDIANLCLRLAISELAWENRDTTFSFIVLDEIFGSLDNERREAVLNALGKLKQRFKQIFVITHLEDIKDRMEYTLMVEEDSENSARASFI